MPPAKDRFSRQAATYRKYRPVYPEALYRHLLDHVPARNRCWDCATGNGQVAVALAPHFEAVYATDISQQQLDQAEHKDNITYRIARAEASGFPAAYFDLITVAQAVHWFDFTAFNQEVRRVSIDGGIVALWGYGLLRIDPEIDAAIDHFYQAVVGPYWDTERRHIDRAYASVPFPYEVIPVPNELAIQDTWDIDHLAGYLRSWSSVQHYRAAHAGADPVTPLLEELATRWPVGARRSARFPIFMRLGRVRK